MNSLQIAVLCAGMAGLAAANTLRGQDCFVNEARGHSGGHASSFRFGAYTFDEGTHVSFTGNERVRKFLANSVEGKFNTHPAYATKFYQGLFVRHPAQCKLRGLPPDFISRCIAGFVKAQYESRSEIKNYQDWCYRGLGDVIGETFTRLYTRKYWTLELEQLTTDWVSTRTYVPKLEEVLDGALAEASGQHYYMSKFHYPKDGGFGFYNNLLTNRCKIEYSRSVEVVNPELKKISFADGSEPHDEYRISSMPKAPLAVREADEKLSCSSHLLVSLGVKRPSVNDAYWMYVYDEDLPYSPITFPSKYSERLALSLYSSVQVEIVHSKYKQLPAKEAIADMWIEGFIRCGVVKERREIDALDVRNIKHANVIFDFDRIPNQTIVHRYLKEMGIVWCGRYGDWEYHWADQSMLSGEGTANQVPALMGLPAGEYTEGVVE